MVRGLILVSRRIMRCCGHCHEKQKCRLGEGWLFLRGEAIIASMKQKLHAKARQIAQSPKTKQALIATKNHKKKQKKKKTPPFPTKKKKKGGGFFFLVFFFFFFSQNPPFFFLGFLMAI